MRLFLSAVLLFNACFPGAAWGQKNNPCLLSETYANAIARDIYRAFGGKGNPPVVHFEATDRLAECSLADPDHPVIHIDPRRVIEKLEARFNQNCATTDADDALAYIIGHEIWHIIKHKKAFAFRFWDVQQQDYEAQAAEIDADVHGLIGAYFAGKTRCLDIYSDIFPALDIKATSRKYPPNQERLRAEKQVRAKAEKTFRLYEAANCLLATNSRQNIQTAVSLYAHISEEFHFLKPLNYNLGLTHLRLALAESSIRYVLPLEPAPNPFANLILRAGTGGVPPKEVTQYLNDAEAYFAAVQEQDPDAFDAWLGKQCVAVVRHATNPRQKAYTVNVYAEGEQWKKQHNLTSLQNDQLKMLEAIAYLLQEPPKDAAKAQALLTSIEQNSPGPALRLQACHNLKSLHTACKTTPNPDFAPVVLPQTDGIQNSIQTHQKYHPESGWAHLTDPGMQVFQKQLDKSALVLIEQQIGKMSFPTVVQIYNDCPGLKPSAAATTGRSEYRCWPGKDGDIVAWRTLKGESRCAKVLTLK